MPCAYHSCVTMKGTTIPSQHNTILLVQCRTIWIASNICLKLSMIFGSFTPFVLRSQLPFQLDAKKNFTTTYHEIASIVIELLVSSAMFYNLIKFGVELENILFDFNVEICYERRRLSYIPSVLLYFLFSAISHVIRYFIQSTS